MEMTMASVNKRRWTRPDGSTGEKWIVRYKDGDAHPQRTFELKKEAEAFRRKVEREIEEGTHVSRRTSRKLRELVTEVCADLERRVEAGQVGEGYLDQTSRCLRYAVEFMGDDVLAEMKWQRVEEFGRHLQHRESKWRGRKFSNTTIRVVLNALKMAFDFGIRRGYAVRNVVGDAIKELGHLPATPIIPFDQNEMRAVIEAIEDRDPRNSRRGQALIRAAVYLGTMCGLRRGEIMALTWDHIDFAGRQIHVRHNLSMKDRVKAPKTPSGVRTVPMPSLVARALEEWRPFVVPEARGLIFRTKPGGIIRASDFYADLWHPVLRKAGFPPVDGRWRHFHATRHFAGSAWLDAGVPLPEVSRLLGHANMQITARIYAHAITEVHHRATQLEQCAGFLAQGVTHQLRIAS